MWVWDIVDTLTGAPRMRVEAGSGSWERCTNRAGSGSHVFHLRGRSNPYSSDEWFQGTLPWARTLVVSWDDGEKRTPVYAGLIRKRVWDRDAGTLTVEHVELRDLLSKRQFFTIGGYPTGDFGVYDLSLRGVAYALIQRAFKRGLHQWDLPVDLPAAEGGSIRRTWWRWTFTTIEDALSEVQETEGGPDIDFRPGWAEDGRLRWEARIGIPRLQAPTYDVHLDAPAAGVLDVQVTEDGSRQLTGVFALGKGSEDDMAKGEAGGVTPYPMPFMDTTRPFKNVEDRGQLDSLARAELAAARYPVEQWTFGLHVSQAPGATVIPGDRIRLIVPADEFLIEQVRVFYVISVKNDGSQRMQVDVQEVAE